MGYTAEHRGRRPKVVVPGTGQFLNLTCIRTNQSREQGSKFVVATVANATMFCHLLPGCSSGS